MPQNRGKKFEEYIRKSFEKIPGVSIDRLHDQTNGFRGSQNICDFIVYKKPYEYYIECKSVHGNVLPFRNITDTQWEGLSKKSQIQGVFAGVICWWVDRDITRFIPIRQLILLEMHGHKSYRYDWEGESIEIKGKKKRIFFNYDMEVFFNEIRIARSYTGRDTET